MNLRILAIDPGSRFTGFAILELNHQQPQVLCSGTWNLSREMELGARIKQLVLECKKLLQLYKPQLVVLESLIFVKNPSSLMKLAQIRGAIIAVISEFELNFVEYSPNLIKQTVTGHGHADKESIQKWITLQTGQSEFESHDESDAIAIALCHWVVQKSSINLIKKSPKSPKRSLRNSLSHRIKELA